MALKITKVDVWVADVRDEPGGVGELLSALADAGANLECVIARRNPSKPGMGEVFLTPVKGRKVQAAAEAVGLQRAEDIATLHVEGTDKPGLGARIARTVADLGVNARGISAMTCGRNFVAYLGFDSEMDADKAARAIRGLERAGATQRRRAVRA